MNVLKDLRIENGLTQTQLAQAIGTTQKNICRWELGETEPSAYYIRKVAEFFDVTTDYVLGIEDGTGQKSYTATNNSVTPEERKILNAYRALSSTNKQMILRMLNID